MSVKLHYATDRLEACVLDRRCHPCGETIPAGTAYVSDVVLKDVICFPCYRPMMQTYQTGCVCRLDGTMRCFFHSLHDAMQAGAVVAR